MSIKPTSVLEWALNSAVEIRGGGDNKIEPSVELKNNGSLDGSFSVNHLNFMFNLIGLWTQFLSDSIVAKNGAGLALVKDDHSTFIVAFNKTTLSQHIVGIAHKNGALAPTIHTIQNSTLTFGTPTIAGDIPINGATATNIVVLSLNFKV
jgi:hypothetical protein